MRYDDPKRPQSAASAHKTPLQVNGSPLPVITLMFPMREGTENVMRCTNAAGCTGTPDERCTACELVETGEWGWLASIHAHRGTNRFGTHYAWLRDLSAFAAEYMEDPEKALLDHFKYKGPEYETTQNAPRGVTEIEDDLFA